MSWSRGQLVERALKLLAVILGAFVVWNASLRWKGQGELDLESKADRKSNRAHDSESHKSPRPRRSRQPRPKPFEHTKAVAMQVAGSIAGTEQGEGLKLSGELKQLLKLTPTEIEAVEASMLKAFSMIATMESATLKVEEDESGRPMWKVPPFPDVAAKAIETLEADFKAILGDDRGKFAHTSVRKTKFFQERGKGMNINFIYYRSGVPALQIRTGNRGQMLPAYHFKEDAYSFSRKRFASLYGHLFPDSEVFQPTFSHMQLAPSTEE